MVALFAVVLAAAPAGAQDSDVAYSCPEGSEGDPTAAFPFCTQLLEQRLAPIETTTRECPIAGWSFVTGPNDAFTCRAPDVRGMPGGLYTLVPPIPTLPLSCPAGSTGVTSDDGFECRKPVADGAVTVTTTFVCPPGTVEQESPVLTPQDGDGPGLQTVCIRNIEILVPAVEVVLVLCRGLEPTIIGTDGDDAILGTEGVDVIMGLGGDDTIVGLGGNDVICGGDGADSIFAGDGRDWVHGGEGRDRIRGGRQADTINGGDNGDKIWGNAGADVLFGDKGNDRIIGNTGDDLITGGRGRVDYLDGRSGSDTCSDSQAGTIRIDCEA